MANSSQEAYHCPSCGAIAPVTSGEGGKRLCGECGFEFRQPVRITPRPVAQASAGGYVQRDLSVRRRQGERVEAVVPREALVAATEVEEDREGAAREEVVSDDGRKRVVRRTRKRRRTRLAPLIFLCGWAVAVMLVVILVRSYADRRGGEQVRGDHDLQKLRAQQRAIAAFLEENHGECWRVLHEFLAANSTAERAQFVRDAGRLAPLMDEYYKGTLPWTVPEDGRLVMRAINLFLAGNRRAIEMVVGVEGSAEEVPNREVAFVRQGGRWVIEWEGLVRYSTQPWQLFFKNAGEREGVFRVYLRKTSVDPKLDEPAMRVQFLPPRDDDLLWEQVLSGIDVPLGSRDGRRLEAIMAAAGGERELGDSIFGASDPAELYRVRVALGWEEDGEGDSRLVLREVQAGSWYGLGFEKDFLEEAAPSGEPSESGKEPPEEEVSAPEGGEE